MYNKKGLKVTVLSAVIAMSAFLTACGAGNSTGNNAGNASNTPEQQNGNVELVVTSFGGTYDEVFEEYIIEPFEAANEGVTVTLAPYTGVAKLNQGGGASVDIVQLDDFDLIDAGNQGLLAELQADQFSHLSDLYDQAVLNGADGKTYGLVNVFGAWGIAYNTEAVDQPESWKDLYTDEQYSGKIALMSQWIPDILVIAAAEGASYDDMEPVWEAYRNFTPSVAQYYSSFSAPESLFGTGEVTAAAWFDGRALTMKEAGQPIDFVVPEEGGVLIRSGMGITAESKNKELAAKLIDFAMSPEAQVGFAKDLYYGPTNSSVELDEELQSMVVYGEESLSKLLAPDWNELLPLREDWLLAWTEATTQ